MKFERIQRGLRNVSYYGAALVGALVNIGTSDCRSIDPLVVERDDTLPAGQASKRYLVRSPRSQSVRVEVNSGFAVSWANPPATLTAEAGTKYATFETSLIEVDCRQIPCSTSRCPNPCEQFEIEVTQPTGATSEAYRLKVTSNVVAGCDETKSELNVEPE